jgi:hypothetical protein
MIHPFIHSSISMGRWVGGAIFCGISVDCSMSHALHISFLVSDDVRQKLFSDSGWLGSKGAKHTIVLFDSAVHRFEHCSDFIYSPPCPIIDLWLGGHEMLTPLLCPVYHNLCCCFICLII